MERVSSDREDSALSRNRRSPEYFLADQLRCSEAVQDFRTVKALLNTTPMFSVRRVFKFALMMGQES